MNLGLGLLELRRGQALVGGAVGGELILAVRKFGMAAFLTGEK